MIKARFDGDVLGQYGGREDLEIKKIFELAESRVEKRKEQRIEEVISRAKKVEVKKSE